MRDAPADAVVVGAGASGPAAAWRLASAGLRVVLLEQGDWLDQRASPSLTPDWEEALQTRFHPDPNIRALQYADVARCPRGEISRRLPPG